MTRKFILDAIIIATVFMFLSIIFASFSITEEYRILLTSGQLI